MLAGILRFRKVEEATTPKDEPTPGSPVLLATVSRMQCLVYLLDELVKATEASPEDAQHIVEHLVKKLESKNPVVKAKALRTCKYLVQKGARDAHRILQRSAAPIRQLQSYKGITDPLKGDALNERVRTLAKETVAVIFSPETATSAGGSVQNRIQGFGNQGSAPSVGNDAGMSKMVGFGNEEYQMMAMGARALTALQSYSQPTPPLAQDRQTTSFLSDHSKIERSGGPSNVDRGGSGINVLGSEEQLVDSICQPGGVRSMPAKEDLRRFIDTAGSLNGAKIGEMLQKKLEGSSWQECLRALCAIEMVILEGSSVSCGEIGVHFQGDLDIIRRCLKSPQRTVRQRAQKILDIFVEEGSEEGSVEATEPPPLIEGVVEQIQQSAPQTSVLDLLDAEVVAPPAQMAKAPIFEGMNLTGPSSGGTASGGDVTGGSQVSDMFSGLALSDSSTPAKGSNVHLAALLAPSPAADPFPEAVAPLKAEGSAPPAVPQQRPPQQFQMPVPGMMPQFGVPQGGMMPSPYLGQIPGAVPNMGVPMQQNAVPMMSPYGMYMQPAMPAVYPATGGMEQGNRGEVPLAAFMGPVHIERRNSSGKGSAAFSFVGDHISKLRERK